MTGEHKTLLDEIESILAAPADGDRRSLERIEDTLTAGYARALALEAERLRLEQRLGEVAASIGEAPAGLGAEEIAGLAQRMSSADGDLSRLRTLLSSLRERARTLRRTSAV